MADARRYETEDTEESRSVTLAAGYEKQIFNKLRPAQEDGEMMESIEIEEGSDLDAARRKCDGLVF
eukprot:CAMPEP_0178500568 /NCGR_PEP_ID=MMETSP0696-20121128/16459_1 /TAXON_ID=265572 /ORGANISM="Extubocellulus spinifer, Strain CCMP396" /LENGTH=65 /DNA_ID=CAMNT_0020129405 /DNA_START=422 /DNA_END=618 /DNA_ORIENTATION=+